MQIELRGVVKFLDNGHEHTDLVVTEGRSARYKTHHMGVDVVLNHGKIITFLSELYEVPAGEIVWPDHIECEVGSLRMSLAL